MRGVSVFVGLTGLFVFGPNINFAQSTAQATPTFEVASVRPSAQPITRGFETRGGPGTSDPERISYLRFPLKVLLITAFTLKADELVGPDWLADSEAFFDIEVKVKPGSTKEQVNQMMQNLLKERFGLAFHFEKKSFTGYDLVIAKGGSKLKPAASPDDATPTSEGPLNAQNAATDQNGFPILPPGRAGMRGVAVNHHMRLTFRKEPLDVLLQLIQGPLGTTHLVNKTGLSGIYDFQLDYAQGGPGPEGAERADPVDPAPDIFAALQKQLGLALEKTTVTGNVLVVDHIEKRPTEN